MRRNGVVAAVVAAALIVTAQGPATAAPSGDKEEQFIVTLRKASGVQALTSARPVAEQYGGTVLRTYTKVLNGFALRATAAEAGRLAADPRVERVEPDVRVS